MILAHPALPAPHFDLALCRVLLVDDDADCLGEYAEAVTSLGYQCVTASDAREALRLIAEDATIGIVITDVQMPAMDGITFLDELASRFATTRVIVPIVVTGFGSMDCAVQAMRFNAVDFLSKPVSSMDIAASLRRASARWAQMAMQLQQTQLAAQGQPAGKTPAPADLAGDVPTKEAMVAQIRSIIRKRQRRTDFLDAELFADPSWDILLDLTLAKLEGAAVPVSSACAAAQVPYTTALRYVKQLVDTGLVFRWKDPTDQRRVLLEIEDRTLDAMTRYVMAIMKHEAG